MTSSKILEIWLKQHQNAEMSEKLVEVYDCYLEVREEMKIWKTKNKRLKEEIERLKDISEIEKDLELQSQGYYIRKSGKRHARNRLSIVQRAGNSIINYFRL